LLGEFPLKIEVMFIDFQGLRVDLNWLVVSTILKNMRVKGKDYSIYYGKIKFMFKTTNQYGSILNTLW